jgi:hypothetical protein
MVGPSFLLRSVLDWFSAAAGSFPAFETVRLRLPTKIRKPPRRDETLALAPLGNADCRRFRRAFERALLIAGPCPPPPFQTRFRPDFTILPAAFDTDAAAGFTATTIDGGGRGGGGELPEPQPSDQAPSARSAVNTIVLLLNLFS